MKAEEVSSPTAAPGPPVLEHSASQDLDMVTMMQEEETSVLDVLCCINPVLIVFNFTDSVLKRTAPIGNTVWGGSDSNAPGVDAKRLAGGLTAAQQVAKNNVIAGGGYACTRCGKTGHNMKYCPTNGDPAFDPEIRLMNIPKNSKRRVASLEGVDTNNKTVVENSDGTFEIFESSGLEKLGCVLDRKIFVSLLYKPELVLLQRGLAPVGGRPGHGRGARPPQVRAQRHVPPRGSYAALLPQVGQRLGGAAGAGVVLYALSALLHHRHHA